MELYLDESGRLNYRGITDRSTVGDLVKAVDEFLVANPTLCERCRTNCCVDHRIYIDNVWYRTCPGAETMVFHFKGEGRFMMLLAKQVSGPCRQLDQAQRCRIYESRPLICRLFMNCIPQAPRYVMLARIATETLAFALGDEQKRKNPDENPAFDVSSYDQVLIHDLIQYYGRFRKQWPEGDQGAFDEILL